MAHQHDQITSYKPIVFGIGAILVLFLVLLFLGLPQHWTKIAAGHIHDYAEQHEHLEEQIDEHYSHLDELPEKHVDLPEREHPDYFMLLPFALLLGAIAFFPLWKVTHDWWESNLHRFYVAASLGLVTLLYYGFFYGGSVDLHWPGGHETVAADAGPWNLMLAVLKNAIVGEYLPLIVLLFSLYSISGGIRIVGNMKAKPLTNSLIILFGASIASFIGTTGAAMLLIRLLLETNKNRIYRAHTVVFFIFCVCNCGGLLLPIGDPPLFIGYLRGVEFLWTMNLWHYWLFMNLSLVAVYFLVDTLIFYRRESKPNEEKSDAPLFRVTGWKLNLSLLAVVVLSVMYLAPQKNFFETLGVQQLCSAFGVSGLEWHPPFFLREAVQLLAVALSFSLGSLKIRQENRFNFHAILEVAALFFGVFICMQVPLEILNAKGEKLPIQTQRQYFWTTGVLSMWLDNAPTYVVFFETAKAQQAAYAEQALEGDTDALRKHRQKLVPVNDGDIDWYILIAVSLGSVFVGASTYIGNGPNFMVKAIAEESGVKMPSFGGYIVYSLVFLLPLFVVMDLLFFR